MTCTTHHICDCLKKRIEKLERVAEAAKITNRHWINNGQFGESPMAVQSELREALAEWERK